jgi:hypothetical protein
MSMAMYLAGLSPGIDVVEEGHRLGSLDLHFGFLGLREAIP